MELGSTYGTAVYGSSGSPLVRQSVEGGRFTVSVRVDDSGGLARLTKGYQLEFTPGEEGKIKWQDTQQDNRLM